MYEGRCILPLKIHADPIFVMWITIENQNEPNAIHISALFGRSMLSIISRSHARLRRFLLSRDPIYSCASMFPAVEASGRSFSSEHYQ